MMKPICIPCQRFFRCIKNDFPFIEGMQAVDGAVAGKSKPENWKPYKLWHGDKWQCPDCGAVIIVGVAMMPLAEHFQPRFDELCNRTGVQLQINDC